MLLMRKILKNKNLLFLFLKLTEELLMKITSNLEIETHSRHTLGEK